MGRDFLQAYKAFNVDVQHNILKFYFNTVYSIIFYFNTVYLINILKTFFIVYSFFNIKNKNINNNSIIILFFLQIIIKYVIIY